MKKIKNLTIRKCFMYALLSMLVIGHVSCKKDKTDENTVKVCIAFDSPDKTQKIYVNGDSAAIYWTQNSKIRMISQTNNVELQYMGVDNKQTANFQVLNDGTMPAGTYIGIFPHTINFNYSDWNNATYYTPDAYLINPTDCDAYLKDYLVMYTDPAYAHGTAPVAYFKPAMSILHLPIQTDEGTYTIDSITLKAIVKPYQNKNPFIKKGLIKNPTNWPIEGSDTIKYIFTGNGLEIGTTPTSVKLLVWSYEGYSTTNLDHYEIIINGTITKKFKTSQTKISNSTYYKLPTLEIATNSEPENIAIGDFYAGGIVFHIFKSGEPGYEEGETHGLVCAPTILGPMKWSDSTTYCSTGTAFGSGENNTQLILKSLGSNGFAAYACDTCTQSGYSDWFLPSRDELDSLKSKAAFLLNYLFLQTVREYWSSSEYNQHGGAWIVQIPGPGGKYYGNKTYNAYVIPVRKF
jgi:hypothetical protein